MGGFASFAMVRLKLFTLDERLLLGRQLASRCTQHPELKPRDPQARLPLLRHWTHCPEEGPDAIAQMGDLAAMTELDIAFLLPTDRSWGP